jgi:hypothetical protein
MLADRVFRPGEFVYSRGLRATVNGAQAAAAALRRPGNRSLAWYLTVVSMGAAGVIAVLIAYGAVPAAIPSGYDTIAYWSARLPNPYGDALYGNSQTFFYSPAIAQLLALVNWIPWPIFLAAWAVLMAASIVWLARGWALVVLMFVPLTIELLMGNINLFLAVAIVLGFRWPAMWAFVLLTKVTPGVGLLWFVVRQEWRSAAIAVGVAAAISLGSFALAPDLWGQWVGILAGNSSRAIPGELAIPFGTRFAAAAVLVIYGARTGRPAVVPVAAMIAAPAIWEHSFAMLIAALPLLARPAELVPALADPATSRRPQVATD